MSLGWRIRGQFGHEAGTAIAGALGAMSIALLSGRPDWWRRVPHFALFGALGWAFGGSMSYMKVVGFCHSSDPATVLYGFAGLFLIGFLSAALGGAGTALPALLDGEALSSLFPPLAVVFAGWFLQDIAADVYQSAGGGPLNWRDSDWLAAAVALAAVLAYRLWRGRWGWGASLVMFLGLGWWSGMLVLVALLGLQLNPPRSDNWAGCVGLFAGLLLFCRRHGLREVAVTALICGFLGGAGFALGQMVKLGFEASGLILTQNVQGGWRSIMEWTHGLLHGAALAVAILPLRGRRTELDDVALPGWTKAFSVFVVLWIIPYLNFRRSPTRWVQHLEALPEYPGGVALVSGFLPSRGFLGWMEVVFLASGALLVWLMIRHLRRPLRIVPADPLAGGQLLFVAFLWACIFISFAHVIVEFSPFIMGVQLAITLQGILCMALMFYGSERGVMPVGQEAGSIPLIGVARLVTVGLVAAALISVSGLCVKRALFGDAFAGFFYKDHIRFGPNNTNDQK
jgi:hypothetical protein